jgi:hypothetical protein
MTAIESARELQGLHVTKGKQLRASSAAKKIQTPSQRYDACSEKRVCPKQAKPRKTRLAIGDPQANQQHIG